MKSCNRCKIIKPIFDFSKNIFNRDGISNRCKKCSKQADKSYYNKHKEKIKQRANNYYKKNIKKVSENSKISYQKNKEKLVKYSKDYREKYKDIVRQTQTNYRKSHRNNIKAYKAKYRSSKLLATPKWADLNKIKEIYYKCPEGYEVDHIIPLKSKLVCGLHVENNLQYLTIRQNRVKSNKV